MRGSVIRAVATVLLVFLVFFFFLVLPGVCVSVTSRAGSHEKHLLVAQHVCADCTGDHSTKGTQRAATELVAHECAAGASYEG